MSAYIVELIDITDHAKYDEYGVRPAGRGP